MVEQFGLNHYKFIMMSNLLDRSLFLKLEETATHGQYSGQPREEQIMNFHEDVGCFFTGTFEILIHMYVQCTINFEENLEL